MSSLERCHVNDGEAARARKDRAIARQLHRFLPGYRRPVAQAAARHPYLADLAISFPALLFLIAVPQHGVDHHALEEAACKGLPLKHLAEIAGVPLWLRGVIPEAFGGPLPKPPTDPLVARQIVNHLPKKPKHAALWLEVVGFFTMWSTQQGAVWMAREISKKPKGLLIDRWTKHDARYALALYVWFSSAQNIDAQWAPKQRWTPQMSIDTAVKNAFDWLVEIRAHVLLGGDSHSPLRLQSGTVSNFTFEQIVTVSDLITAAAELKNCSLTYAANIALGQTQLWRVSTDGKTVGMLNLSNFRRWPFPSVRQFCGLKNCKMSSEAVTAAWDWLRAQALSEEPKLNEPSLVEVVRRDVWISVWRAYWLGLKRIPDWMPLSPTQRSLNILDGR
jgi:hypothetical protein